MNNKPSIGQLLYSTSWGFVLILDNNTIVHNIGASVVRIRIKAWSYETRKIIYPMVEDLYKNKIIAQESK
jgi:hypothetical protein|tara:strand:+ start:2345 stop:2554 length:210 start_codon:yes stop_codon:yes gene_type:complete